METNFQRPDPDVLLRRVTTEEERNKRAKLKIFFGFAPGVGKTFRMLQVAQELKAQNIDVVVGLVETHGRQDTKKLIHGLELLQRRHIEYRGHPLDEFDLEGAIKRHPKVILVDELAHTNAPESKHTKRWQDILDLLNEGIDVYTTLNVQHIESLNDVIAQITHIQVRETVPDSILERADEIELVDIAPEELLARLRDGKIYLPDQALRATQHFFERGNLLALRELALRSTAERVDVDVQAYREEHDVEETWQTAERILVCVSPSPASARLVRATRRMAAGLKASWSAVYIDTSSLRGMTKANRDRLESHLRLAEALGGKVVRLIGANMSESILAYAKRHHITRIIIGKPTHPKFRDFIQGSFLNDIVRGSGDIDVHVISGDTSSPNETHSSETQSHLSSPASAYIWALGIVGLVLAIAGLVRLLVPLPDIEMLFLIGVMLTALKFGRGPSLFASAVSVAAYDYFFVPPYFTFEVQDSQYILTFMMMFGIGATISDLTTRIQRHEKDALMREERTTALYALSRDLADANTLQSVADISMQHASDFFRVPVSIFGIDSSVKLTNLAFYPASINFEKNHLSVAEWTHMHRAIAGVGTDTLPGSGVLCAPLLVDAKSVGVMMLMVKENLTLEQQSFLEAFCRQVAFSFERTRLREEAKKSMLKAKTEELRSTLLSSVSHDLRTPLAVITGSATTLRDGHLISEEIKQELIESICEEAIRLERLLSNLLDMTRLDSGNIKLKQEWVPVVEIIGSVLNRLEKQLSKHHIIVHLPDELPFIFVDPVLIEQLFVNLLENSIKYSPSGTDIEITAHIDSKNIIIDIQDKGIGIPQGDEERIFERFYRGHHTGISGVGLGLPICRSIAQAHGGKLMVENRIKEGALFRLSIPLIKNNHNIELQSSMDKVL